MANQVFDKAREKFLAADGTLLWSSASSLKVVLADADQAFHTGGAAGGYRITGVTNVTNPTVSTAAAHGLAVNDVVTIVAVGGATGIIGTFTVASVPTSTTFTVTAAAPGVYTSGGYLFRVSDTFLADSFPTAAQIARSAALGSVTNTNGVAGATNLAPLATVNAITGQVNGAAEWLIIFQANVSTGGADVADSAARVIFFIDTATGLPIIPNGGALNVNWNASGIFKL